MKTTTATATAIPTIRSNDGIVLRFSRRFDDRIASASTVNGGVDVLARSHRAASELASEYRAFGATVREIGWSLLVSF
jgi:hypothetical protein